MNSPLASLKILVVDDEPNMRRVLEIMLSRRNYRTVSAANGHEAFDLVQSGDFDLVISDLRMPLINGIELLRKMRDAGIDIPLIMITAQGSIESAVEAMRLGACDYLLRPFDVEALDLSISRVFRVSGVLRHNEYLRDQADRVWEGLVGSSPAILKLRENILRVAPTKATVLISGETGTGKEVVARAIHRTSPRKDELFVAINCAAIPADILESELFGHERGAFTGAHRDRIGKFELASRGTIFLDEITEMPLALQAKLLRVLQEGVVERLGSNRNIELDLRVVAATNRSPKKALIDGRLREDLYYRLNVFSIEVPPLRNCIDDLPSFIDHFIRIHHATSGRPPTLSASALKQLQAYHWPGNVRELGNLVERALILSNGDPILGMKYFPLEPLDIEMESSIAREVDPDPGDLKLEPAVEALERKMIVQALKASGNNKSRAAQILDISERSIWYKLKKYHLGLD